MRRVIYIILISFTLTQLLSAEMKKFEGIPVFFTGMSKRYIIWEEHGVFKLRTTTSELLNKFSGTIYALDGEFKEVRVVSVDPDDQVYLSQDKKVIYFNFITKLGIDGFNFKTNAGQLACFLYINNKKANKFNEIFLGAKGNNPTNNPFILFVTGLERNDKVIGIDDSEKKRGNQIKELIPADMLEDATKVRDN